MVSDIGQTKGKNDTEKKKRNGGEKNGALWILSRPRKVWVRYKKSSRKKECPCLEKKKRGEHA